MNRVSDGNLTSLFNELRTFNYKKEIDGVVVDVTATLYPQEEVGMVTALFEDNYGDLRTSGIMDKFIDEEIGASQLSSLIKRKYSTNWKHFLGAWESEYNPIWNVDGTEKHTVITKYGKIETLTNGKVETTEQLVDGTDSTTFGKTVNNTETVNLSDSTTFGKTVANNETVNLSDATTFGKTVANNETVNLSDATTFGKTVNGTNAETTNVTGFNNSTTVSGSNGTTDGGSETISKTGTDNTNVTEGGSETLIKSGTDNTNITEGGSETVAKTGTDTNASTEGGSESTSHSVGKISVSNSGNDVNAESGQDEVTDVNVRGGNIGVTMTQQLLTAERDFWEFFNFFDSWMKSIAEVISIPIFCSED